jgi:hypothetical protein
MTARAGFTGKPAHKFAIRVDLYRLSGVGSESARPRKASGVDKAF